MGWDWVRCFEVFPVCNVVDLVSEIKALVAADILIEYFVIEEKTN